MTRHRVIGGALRHLAGCRPPPPMHPEHPLMAAAPMSAIPTPDHAASIGAPLRDQGAVGDCVLNTIIELVNEARAAHGLPPLDMSARYGYAVARSAAGIPLTEDSGVTISGACDALTRTGWVPEAGYPSDAASFDEAWQDAPPASMLIQGLQYRLNLHYRVPNVHALEASIAQGYGPAIGIPLFESFEGKQSMKTGVVPDPGPREAMIGYHCVKADRYDRSKKHGYRIQNSWGPDVGDHGFFDLTREYLERYARDMRTVRLTLDMLPGGVSVTGGV